MMRFPFYLGVLLLLGLSAPALAQIPATPVMTLYRFNGPLRMPYYDADAFARRGTKAKPAGYLTQGTSLIPCLVLRKGKPLTDARGTPYIGWEKIVVDAARAGPKSTERFRRALKRRKGLRVKNHHCPTRVKHVINVRNFYALKKAPFFDPPSASSRVSKAVSTLDRLVREFHESSYCARANRTLTGRRAALQKAWDRYIAARKQSIPLNTLARAKHLDYALRTALFEGHLGRGCNAYGACERNIVALSIRNRAKGQCLKRHGCRFPGDFQGVASKPSQYNIWDEYLTQISGLTACFLRKGLDSAHNRHNGEYYDRLQRMYAQNVGDVERILYGSDEDLKEIFPSNRLSDLKALRHYYHAPAMGKCFPKHRRVEYMSGAVAHRGKDYALIANTRIQVGKSVGKDYRFREFRFTEQEDRDQVRILDNYPGFLVDGRKVRLRSARSCPPYGIPRGCQFSHIGRYRKTPSWLKQGKPLALKCHLQDRGKSCKAAPRTKTVWVGGTCDTQMRPVAHVP